MARAMTAGERAAACAFCAATALRLVAAGIYHPRVPSHGPLDLYECDACGSLVTWPVPSDESLARLYAAFDEGIDPALRRLRVDSPLSSWYTRAAARAAHVAGRSRASTFTWIDVAAGAGEIGEALNRQFPNARGTSIDWHGRPSGLADDARHEWLTGDLNAPGFGARLDRQADVVTAIAIWEHVRDPARFLDDAATLVKPGGTLYLVCPDYGSLAHRIMRRRWPYWIPGEHLHIPTRRGARRCLERRVVERGIAHSTFVRSVGIPYPVAYVSGFFGVRLPHALGRRLPDVPLPVGVLEAGFTSRAPA